MGALAAGTSNGSSFLTARADAWASYFTSHSRETATSSTFSGRPALKMRACMGRFCDATGFAATITNYLEPIYSFSITNNPAKGTFEDSARVCERAALQRRKVESRRKSEGCQERFVQQPVQCRVARGEAHVQFSVFRIDWHALKDLPVASKPDRGTGSSTLMFDWTHSLVQEDGHTMYMHHCTIDHKIQRRMMSIECHTPLGVSLFPLLQCARRSSSGSVFL
ncbi:hypothetical protein U1Q18_044810 [Sarracenia purpurea var. burkii]